MRKSGLTRKCGQSSNPGERFNLPRNEYPDMRLLIELLLQGDVKMTMCGWRTRKNACAAENRRKRVIPRKNLSVQRVRVHKY